MDLFAVEMSGITKSFASLKANDNVNLKIRKAEIHALVGENGAGKSTLMKILYGMYSADSGSIKINGKKEFIDSPSKAITLGIGMVHQHFMLVNTMTVLENIILGAEDTKAFRLLDLREAGKKINNITKDIKIDLQSGTITGTLPVGAQQKVEILKVLYRNADILILDEPTAVLTPQEADELFNTLRDLRSKGKTIILITHKLQEVMAVSDSVTVLRRGSVTGSTRTADSSPEELAKLMVGADFSHGVHKKSVPGRADVLSVVNLSVLNDRKAVSVKGVTFSIKEGEIFGIAGVEGNGQAELAEAVTGLRKVHKGIIKLDGKEPGGRIQIAHIPADRLRNGIVEDYSLAENVILGRQRENKFSTSFWMKKDAVRNFSNELAEKFDIKSSGPLQRVKELSGGNQQKVVVARELSRDTRLIVVSHPTRGLDIKATDFVHSSLIEASSKGNAVLLVSSDLQELLKLCGRIGVMYNGELTAVLDASKTGERELGLYMAGVKKANE